MKRIVLAFFVVLLFGALPLSSASVSSTAPQFRKAPYPSIKVGGSPTALAVGDVLNGDGLDEFSVLDSEGRLILYENVNGKRFEKAGSVFVGTPATGLAMEDAGSSAGEFATVNPDTDTLTYVRDPYERPDELHVAGKLEVGDRPTNVVSIADFGYSTWASSEPALAITNGGDDTISLVSFDGNNNPVPYGEVPVGNDPSDVASVDPRTLLVANEDSNDVTLVRGAFSTDSQTYEYKPTQTLPAGSAPVAVRGSSQVSSGKKGIAFMVVNRGSDSVTTYGWNGDQLEKLESIPVGDRPTAITGFQTGHKGLSDYAVTNAGSHDITLLTGRGESLDPVGRVKIAGAPSAIVGLRANPFFASDLAVTNPGAGSVSVLLRHETSGVCLRHPARLLKLTPDQDHSYATSNPDRVLALAGDDEVSSGRGGDCIYGGSGDDLLDGGSESDLVDGGPGNDRLTGSGDSDIVRGGPGDDHICEMSLGYINQCWKEVGPVDLKQKTNLLDGGPGRDFIEASGEADRIKGGSGSDRIVANERGNPRYRSPDQIDCGSGVDKAVVDRFDTTKNCERVKVK